MQMLDLDLQRFDGISMRVKGDGQTYKFNLKTADQMNVPESTYQAQYDTVDGEWTTVYMAWHEFVPVTRAQYDAKAKPLNPAQVKQIGLVLSRFHYNSLPNQRHKPGNFELKVDCPSPCISPHAARWFKGSTGRASCFHARSCGMQSIACCHRASSSQAGIQVLV